MPATPMRRPGPRWRAGLPRRRFAPSLLSISRHNSKKATAPGVVAGIGAATVAEVARRLGRDPVPFETLLDVAQTVRERASQCAPAAALAVLATAAVK